MRLTVWVVAMMLGEIFAMAQTSGGSVSGLVSDAAGGAVPDVLVTMENQPTGEVRAVRTNDKGFYSFPSLAPGSYNAVASHSGFGNVTKKNLVVAVGEQLMVDFEINVGAVESSMEVAARTQEISLTSSTLTNVVGEQTIRQHSLS